MSSILHRVLEPLLIAGMKIDQRTLIWSELDRLTSVCENCISGPLFLMYNTQNGQPNKELCYPIIKQVKDKEIETKMIGRCEAYSIFHFGDHKDLDIIVSSFIQSLSNSYDMSDVFVKEIYHEIYQEDENENVTEIQLLIPLENE